MTMIDVVRGATREARECVRTWPGNRLRASRRFLCDLEKLVVVDIFLLQDAEVDPRQQRFDSCCAVDFHLRRQLSDIPRVFMWYQLFAR